MTRLEVKRSRSPGWKMPWPKQPYLRNGKAYELQTWCADGVQLSISSTCAVTSEVKVTPPLNAVTENPPYLFPKPQLQKAADLQIWPTDGVWWPISLTCVVTYKLKALSGCSSHHLQVAGACGGHTILWLPHYRPHGSFSSCASLWWQMQQCGDSNSEGMHFALWPPDLAGVSK